MALVIFLTIEQVLLIHDDQVERYGGGHGIRNLSLLESAVFRCQTTFAGQDLYESLYDKAAALMHSLIMNHAFVDGNKRTGVVSTIVFLKLNKLDLKVTNRVLFQTAVAIEQEKWNIDKISFWLKDHSRKVS